MATAMGGTLSLYDSAYAKMPVLDYGLERAYDEIKRVLAIHNKQVAEMRSELCEVTEDSVRHYDGVANVAMVEVDEFGVPARQKVRGGVDIGFPLRRYQIASGWNRDYLNHATMADFAKDMNVVFDAHLRKIKAVIQRCVFNDDNTTETDSFGKTMNVGRPVKAFYNADSGPIAIGPNGESFDGSSHTHFAVGTPITATLLEALISNVAEHNLGLQSGALRVYIHTDEESTIRGFTGFVAAVDLATVVPSISTDRTNFALIYNNRWDRRIGTFKGAEIWVKPWIPSAYLFAFDASADPKPLVWRLPGKYASAELTPVFQSDANFPTTVKVWEHAFGIGVWGRQNGAVHYVNAGPYAEPSFTGDAAS